METINSYKNGLKIISHKYSQGKQLIEFFTSTGFDANETINARRKLASLLFS